MSATVSIRLTPIKKNAKYKHPFIPSKTPVYIHGDTVKGTVTITIDSDPVSHTGISVGLKGIYKDETGEEVDTFFEKAMQVLPASTLSQKLTFPFSFRMVAFPFPTYHGHLLNIMYVAECTLGGENPIITRVPFTVMFPSEIAKRPVRKMIGIRSVTHILVMFDSDVIDARKCFVGAIMMAGSMIRLTKLTLELHRNEVVRDAQGNTQEVNDRIGSFEIMDGTPVRGTLVPIRMFLGGWKCWPSPKVNSCRISCKYTLQLIVNDDGGGIYMKRIPVELDIEK